MGIQIVTVHLGGLRHHVNEEDKVVTEVEEDEVVTEVEEDEVVTEVEEDVEDRHEEEGEEEAGEEQDTTPMVCVRQSFNIHSFYNLGHIPNCLLHDGWMILSPATD